MKNSELCWITHEIEWGEKEFLEWKEWLNNNGYYWEYHFSDVDNKSFRFNAAKELNELLDKLTWKEIVADFQRYLDNGQEPDEEKGLYIEVKPEGCNSICRIYLAQVLHETMEEDCWDSDEECSDPIDMDSECYVKP